MLFLFHHFAFSMHDLHWQISLFGINRGLIHSQSSVWECITLMHLVECLYIVKKKKKIILNKEIEWKEELQKYSCWLCACHGNTAVSQLASVAINTFFHQQRCGAFHPKEQRETTQLFPLAAGMTFAFSARPFIFAATKQFSVALPSFRSFSQPFMVVCADWQVQTILESGCCTHTHTHSRPADVIRNKTQKLYLSHTAFKIIKTPQTWALVTIWFQASNVLFWMLIWVDLPLSHCRRRLLFSPHCPCFTSELGRCFQLEGKGQGRQSQIYLTGKQRIFLLPLQD